MKRKAGFLSDELHPQSVEDLMAVERPRHLGTQGPKDLGRERIGGTGSLRR